MKYLAAFLAAVVLGFGLMRFATDARAVAPPSSAQTNADIYSCCGFPSVFAGTTSGDLQSLNPISQKLRANGRTVTYSYVVVPGCADGNMRATLAESLADASDVLHLTFAPVSSGADLTIRATCGVDASNMGLTGGAICDLYPSWPYKSQVNCSSTMATFYDLSQETIWSHEIVGHGLGTWNEQYALDGNFSSTPGLVDFMNTGDASRQTAWPQNDKDRWERTMYALSAPLPYEACTTYAGWAPTVSCYWPSLDKWLWSVPTTAGAVEIWEWSPASPQWTCSKGCPGQ